MFLPPSRGRGAPEGTVILANRQTQGRGRLGRDFFSPADTGLYLSLLLRPSGWEAARAARVTTMAAVAVCEAVEEGSGRRPELLAAPQQDQVSLEALGEAEVIDRLRRTQPDTLSPMEALNLLYELKQKLP